jgi:uncharacterized protein YutE (UPF0331/DUF86 family)
MKEKIIDKDKILAKLDEIDSYLEEIEQIMPVSFEEYQRHIEKRRAVERLLQISIESIIDISYIIISNLKLGAPSDEDELFDKLTQKNIISKDIAIILKEMKGFRNVLVHKYGKVDDEQVFENLEKLDDFEKFKKEILRFLGKH